MRHELLITDRIPPAFTDQRGDITNIISEPLRHVAIISSVAGSVRGHHYHIEGGQYIYVIRGRLVSVSIPVPTDPSYNAERHGYLIEFSSFEAGEGALLYCPPMVAHAYRFLEDTVFLNLDTAIRRLADGTDDTRPYTVIHPLLEAR